MRRAGKTIVLEGSGDEGRAKLVAGARKHFFAHGFRGVTMDDLADELRMSKRTFYRFFRSKSALIQAVMDHKFNEVKEDLERVSEGNEGFEKKLTRLLACMQSHADEIKPSFVRDVQREAPELFEVVQKRRAELIRQYFGALLGDGQRTGLVRKDIPIQAIIEIMLGAVQSVVNPKKLAELSMTPERGYSSVMKVVLEGVVTSEERKRR